MGMAEGGIRLTAMANMSDSVSLLLFLPPFLPITPSSHNDHSDLSATAVCYLCVHATGNSSCRQVDMVYVHNDLSAKSHFLPFLSVAENVPTRHRKLVWTCRSLGE